MTKSPLKLYNTLSRKKEVFTPISIENVGIYVCGPTVYDLAHLGNARSAVVFDLLRDVLETQYQVTFVRNITDVDDKIIDKAQQDNISIAELTEKTYRAYISDMTALGVRLPTIEPRATQHIAQMQTMITRLLDLGFAYEAEGHVLFNVDKNPRQGILSGKTMTELKAGARVEVATYKVNPADFVLWKPAQGGPGWDSPWGFGRPGWHIECSAMSAQYLGSHFDIHGGGIDLIFPHHENENAQSTCAHGNTVMANYWMHNGMLTVEGKKMSKSLGNFTTVQEAMKEKRRGDALRFLLLSGHYRHELDFTQERLDSSIRTMDDFLKLVTQYGKPEKTLSPHSVLEALRDDLNSPMAIGKLYAMMKTLKSSFNENLYSEFYASLNIMGFFRAEASMDKLENQDVIEALVLQRYNAKMAKDFKTADSIREKLTRLGIMLEDTQTGTKWKKI